MDVLCKFLILTHDFICFKNVISYLIVSIVNNHHQQEFQGEHSLLLWWESWVNKKYKNQCIGILFQEFSLEGLNEPTTLYIDDGNRKECMKEQYFWLTLCLFCTWPYRCWFKTTTEIVHYKFVKLIGVWFTIPLFYKFIYVCTQLGMHQSLSLNNVKHYGLTKTELPRVSQLTNHLWNFVFTNVQNCIFKVGGSWRCVCIYYCFKSCLIP